MNQYLKTWTGKVELNGKLYESTADLPQFIPGTQYNIKLIPTIAVQHKTQENVADKARTASTMEADVEYVITVKPYMTKPSTPQFDFMQKWNNDIPMPLVTMVGKKIKETPGMVYMELHGEIIEKVTTTCMACGRPLTNKVSQFFGIGPECGHHNYINPFDTDEELQQAVSQYKEQLRQKTWTGWVIKSAIKSFEKFKNEG